MTVEELLKELHGYDLQLEVKFESPVNEGWTKITAVTKAKEFDYFGSRTYKEVIVLE